jgi:hypothetical protein
MTRTGLSASTLLAGVGSLLLTGCPVVEDLLSDEVPEQAASEIEDDRDPIIATDEKLRAYIECRDSLEGPVAESWDRYAEHVDVSGKPKRRNRAFIYPVGKASFRTCVKVLAEAPKVRPSMPEIERSANEMVSAASEYAQVSRQLNRYFEHEEFKDDDWALLGKLHPKLAGAHERWLKSDSVLALYLDTEKSRNDPKLLEILSQDGETLEFHVRSVMVHARPLAKCFRDPQVTAEECRQGFTEFEDEFKAFESAYNADRDAADHVFWMTAFVADVHDFHAAAADYVGKLDEQGRRRGNDDLLLRYKNLVRDHNTLDFEFP